MSSILPRSRRRIRLRSEQAFALLILSTMVGLEPRAAAQTMPLLPAVDIRTASGAVGETWPADMNRDGRTDLVSGSASGLAVWIGNGDGTFAAPVASRTPGQVLAVGDLNHDGRLDVVAESDDVLVVLPGNGTATLGAPRAVLDGGMFTFASVADMDNDGTRDLVVGQEGSSLHVLPGNRDFTFDPPFTFTTAAWPHGHIVADLNDDGLRDIVVAHRYERALTIFQNGGTFAFSPVSLPMRHSSSDVTARDLNGDRAVDLVVSARGPGDDEWAFGLVYVYVGRGDGTFDEPLEFPTAPGTQSVVAGDFTRDGRIDIATANRSGWLLDTSCSLALQGVDSVSLLPGAGDATFGAPITFALAPEIFGTNAFHNVVGTLNTSDVNRDGHVDLITTDGTILFNAAPRTNRPPVADAGEDRTVFIDRETHVSGAAHDPDHHLLSFLWSKDSPAAPTGERTPADTCVALDEGSGIYTFYFNASDGHGGLASDSVDIESVSGDGPGPLPAEWGNEDVGAVGAAGSATYDPNAGQFAVTGSGGDIWGTADEFHWMHQSRTGDFTMYAQVLSVEHVDRWTKAGLMVREGTGAGARHASIFVTPTTEKGLSFQRRTATNGASVATAGPALTASVWVMLKRTGNVIGAYYSTSGLRGTWTLVGRQSFASLSSTVEIGFAVTSHRDGRLAEATFNALVVVDGDFWWTQDVGAVGVPGGGAYINAPEELTIEGSGADIWGRADAFRFHNTWWTFDGTLTARVRSIEHTDPWAKAGVMFRESLQAGSRHVMLVVTPGKGLAMQYRSSTGGISANVALQSGVRAPEWVRLTRAGNTFTGFASEDGTTWRRIGSVTVAMDGDTFAGLAVTSHDNDTLATGEFAGFTLVR